MDQAESSKEPKRKIITSYTQFVTDKNLNELANSFSTFLNTNRVDFNKPRLNKSEFIEFCGDLDKYVLEFLQPLFIEDDDTEIKLGLTLFKSILPTAKIY